jgi:N utilization substance protein B
MAEQIDWYMEELFELPEEESAYLRNKCSDIVAHVQELDDAISEKATSWKPSRMGKVDLTLLRLAVYEIRYEEAIPFKVAVNEAVELAKKYGTDDSPSFVNGVLAKFAEHDEQ